MARPLRIEYPGAWYHVMNRGAGRRTVFPNDDLRRMFLSLLRDVYERYAVRCHAFCLMGNHYHFLMHTPQARLGRAMRHIDGVYTQRHNRTLQTDGPLFRGRYKAQLVEDGEYLWTVSRYIHRNPVESGLCGDPVNYEWSSYRFFAHPDATPPKWLQVRRTLAQFGSRSAYRRFVAGAAIDVDAESQLVSADDSQRCPPILGSDEFVERMRERVDFDCEVPESGPAPVAQPVEPMAMLVCRTMNWSLSDLRIARNKQQRYRRGLIATALRQFTSASNGEIGAVFGIGYSAVASIIHRCRIAAGENANVATDLDRIGHVLRENEKWEDLTP